MKKAIGSQTINKQKKSIGNDNSIDRFEKSSASSTSKNNAKQFKFTPSNKTTSTVSSSIKINQQKSQKQTSSDDHGSLASKKKTTKKDTKKVEEPIFYGEVIREQLDEEEIDNVLDENNEKDLDENNENESDLDEDQEQDIDELNSENDDDGDDDDELERDNESDLEDEDDDEEEETEEKDFAQQVEEYNAKEEKKGIVYLSTIPPRMTPTKIKQILSQFGTITKIFLAKERKGVKRKRVSSGGSKTKRFVEGWIEFEDKKVAKMVAFSLNNTPIGGQSKKSYHYDDRWTLKYLSGFKWRQLTEQLDFNKRLHENKLRTMLSQEKKTNEIYKQRVEDAEDQRETLQQNKAASQSKLNRKRRREEQRAQQQGGTSSVEQKKPVANDRHGIEIVERSAKKRKPNPAANFI